MEGTHLVQPAVAALVAAFVAARAYRRKSLDLSGALAGFLVMAVHIAAGYRYGAMLLVFFFSSSKLTKVGEEKKREVDADFKEGGQRNCVFAFWNTQAAILFFSGRLGFIMADSGEAKQAEPGNLEETVCSFFRKPSRNKNIRKRDG
ncbi:protein PGR-like [Eucalyptus grandis]|uniref:protein PGR-like n=1 Tax=Eucalyptus grandis TaxID=71139 RepID=UPI00192EDFD3|nr:protein PGR-like [Eucalyptus grandis]